MTKHADVIKPGCTWNGYQTFDCLYPGCGMNDTNYERLVNHVEKIHKVFFGTRKLQTSLVDIDGQPLFMEVTHDVD